MSVLWLGQRVTANFYGGQFEGTVTKLDARTPQGWTGVTVRLDADPRHETMLEYGEVSPA